MACSKAPAPAPCPPVHNCGDGGCGCITTAMSAAESATHSANAAAESALLAHKVLQNCLSDKTIKPGGGLKVDENAGVGEGGIYVDIAALAAPNGGLTLSGGKLAVNAGKGLSILNGKLVVDVSGMTAAELKSLVQSLIKTGGGLAADDDGKLKVDFSSIPKADRQQLLKQLVQTGGGLAVNSDGRLYFDADSMDTTVFEKMMAKLRLPLWLEGNLDLYVDGSKNADGSYKYADTLEDGRGTAAKPFRTLKKCLDWALTNYNLNKYNMTINVAAADYYGGARAEEITIGTFQATTGKLTIKGAGRNSVKLPPIKVDAAGQGVYLTSLTIGSYPAISVQDSSLHVLGSNAYLLDVAFDHSNMTADNVSGLYNLMCAEKGSLIELLPSQTEGLQGIYFKNSNSSNRQPSCAMKAYDNSKISVYCDLNIESNFSFGEFALAENYSTIYGDRRTWVAYPSSNPQTKLNGHTVTGKRYVAKVFSNIDVRYGDNWFPGNEGGSCYSGSIDANANS